MRTGDWTRQAGLAEMPAYPASSVERDRFVLALRPPRRRHDPWRHQGVLVEEERAGDGSVARAATIFLTGRECPWRCAMCDLWTYTTEQDTPRGALVQQVLDARGALVGPLPECVKLYNAGSFFDPRAVPDADYAPLAAALRGFRHIVVESHPLLVGRRLVQWTDALQRAAGECPAPSLEVAMGLETAHLVALERLHKRFTLAEFARAADRVHAAGAALRVFLLVGVPFLTHAEQLDWLRRSVAFAFECGASVVSLIPTRSGNGALEALADEGLFEPPCLQDLERAFEVVLPGASGRVFADLWNVGTFARCDVCLEARRDRLRGMNLTQQVLRRVDCEACGVGDYQV